MLLSSMKVAVILILTRLWHEWMPYDMENRMLILADKQSGRPSGSLSSNTQPKLKGISSKPYQPPQARNEHVNAVFMRSGKSYDPPTNPNDQQNDSENPVNFDSDDEDEELTPQPKSQTPKPVNETPIPKPYKPKISYPQCLRKENWKPNMFLKELVSKKHKLEQISSAFLSDESSGKPFLHTADAVIRVKQKQLNLGVGTKRMTFHIDSAMKHSYLIDDTCFSIGVVDEILKEDFDALLDKGSNILHSIDGTIHRKGKLFANSMNSWQ
ncbi:hypothetical protein Tco_0578227 [Tanacetum coccineum]